MGDKCELWLGDWLRPRSVGRHVRRCDGSRGGKLTSVDQSRRRSCVEVLDRPM